jgi:hypothetical protein
MCAPSRRKGLPPRAFAGNRRTPTSVNEPSFPRRQHHHRAIPKCASGEIPVLGHSMYFAPVWGIRPAGWPARRRGLCSTHEGPAALESSFGPKEICCHEYARTVVCPGREAPPRQPVALRRRVVAGRGIRAPSTRSTHPPRRRTHACGTRLGRPAGNRRRPVRSCRVDPLSGCRAKSGIPAAIAATQAGFTKAFDLLEGFEGDKDGQGHRKTVSGWCFRGLPWIGA